MYFTLVALQLAFEHIGRRNAGSRHQCVYAFTKDRLATGGVLQVDRGLIYSYEPRVRDHLYAQPVQLTDPAVAHVLLDGLSWYITINGESNVTTVPGELFGNSQAHPVTTPISHHDPCADVGTFREQLSCMDHMGSLFDQKIGNVRAASCRQYYRVRLTPIDEGAIDPDTQLNPRSGGAHLSLQISDNSTELGTFGERRASFTCPPSSASCS